MSLSLFPPNSILSMLHELLLALLGHTGGTIISGETGLCVRPDVTYLSSSEKALVQRMLKVADQYLFLMRFVQKFGSLTAGIDRLVRLRKPAQEEDEESTGLYVKAFCKGIDNILGAYRRKVIDVEQDYLASRTLTIGEVEQRISSDELRILVSLVRTIDSEQLRGTQLLNLVLREQYSPALEAYFSELSQHLKHVLLQQLMAWLLHGHLLDSYREFFICVSESQAEDWTAKYTLNLDMLPDSVISPKLAEKILFIGMVIQVINKESGLTVEEAQAFATALTGVVDAFRPMTLARIIEEIRFVVAKKLWNVVVVKYDLLGHIQALKNYFLLSKGEFIHELLEESVDIMALPPKVDSAARDLNAGPFAQAMSTLHLEDDTYIKHFSLQLNDPGFNFPDFARMAKVSLLGNVSYRQKKLLRLITNRFSKKPAAIWHTSKHKVDSGFYLQMTFHFCAPLKPGLLYFMVQSEKEVLGQYEGALLAPEQIMNGMVVEICSGEAVTKVRVILNREVIAENESLIRVQDGKDHKVVLSYEKSALKLDLDGATVVESSVQLHHSLKLDLEGSAYIGVGAKGDSCIELLSWAMATANYGLRPAVHDSWNGLTMDYTPKWPLHLMLTPQILDKYRALFRFLFSIKRAQYHLQRLWMKQVRSVQTERAAFQLRAHMSFFIDNIMAYAQLDVIEVQHSKLQKSLSSTEDFQDLKRLHELFITTVASQCFLHVPKIVGSIQEVLRCAYDLCEYASGNMDRLKDLKTRFEKDSGFIFKILSSIKSQHMSLGQLLLRLDYNRFQSEMQRRMDRAFLGQITK